MLHPSTVTCVGTRMIFHRHVLVVVELLSTILSLRNSYNQVYLDASRRGKQLLNCSRYKKKMKTPTVVARGEKNLLSDPGSELREKGER